MYVREYNAYRNTAETLRDISPGNKVGTLNGHAYAVPTSMGLAQWLTNHHC